MAKKTELEKLQAKLARTQAQLKVAQAQIIIGMSNLDEANVRNIKLNQQIELMCKANTQNTETFVALNRANERGVKCTLEIKELAESLLSLKDNNVTTDVIASAISDLAEFCLTSQ